VAFVLQARHWYVARGDAKLIIWIYDDLTNGKGSDSKEHRRFCQNQGLVLAIWRLVLVRFIPGISSCRQSYFLPSSFIYATSPLGLTLSNHQIVHRIICRTTYSSTLLWKGILNGRGNEKARISASHWVKDVTIDCIRNASLLVFHTYLLFFM
jgi:hypothetical protein